ncbi:MAG TPA: PEP-CTERM sorting domain-containing protein [Chitinispirillaceae bacterium]|nr:PEP-CTERM sorting domain-containing protein [Chitinispirillaceae bacterium]
MKNTVFNAVTFCAIFAGIARADLLPVHNTTQWQSIGRETIATNGSSNNGVFYSVDGGSSWLNLSSGLEFSVGQTVDFKVEIYKEFQGTHYSDVAKVWLDDVEMAKGEWTLASNGNEKTVTERVQTGTWGWGWPIYENKMTTSDYYDGNVYDDSQNPITDLSKLTYLGSIGFSKTFTEARDYEITARAMCSDDLSNVNTTDGNPQSNTITYIGTDNKTYTKTMNMPTDNDWNAFTSTNPVSTLQGEAERYVVKVVARDVPEPTSLSLMLLGLTSLGGALLIRRKK